MFGLSGKAKGERVALVDVSSSSVRAAYALFVPNAQVRILFETKVAIDVISTANDGASMLRAMDEALRQLRAEGAPLMHTVTGSGSVSRVFASVCAPWQIATLRTETRTEEKPFTVTENNIRDALGKEAPPKGQVRTEEAVVATLLNGYETARPVGKRASRAEIIVLSATMDEDTFGIMRQALASFAGSRDVHFSTFASVAFRAISSAFPHEEEYLTVRVSGEATEVAFVKRGFPISTGSIPIGLNVFSRAAKESGISAFAETHPETEGVIDREKSAGLSAKLAEAEKKWTTQALEGLRTLAASHALPRTVFLLCDDEARAFMTRLMDAPELHPLWLSDEPLSIIALDASHFATFIARDRSFQNNAPIDLLALHARSILGG